MNGPESGRGVCGSVQNAEAAELSATVDGGSPPGRRWSGRWFFLFKKKEKKQKRRSEETFLGKKSCFIAKNKVS